MSRSRKKPYHSTTCIGSRAGMQKDWKKECNRSIRHSKEIYNGGYFKKMNHQWDSPNDGKRYNPEWPKAWRK